jgi:hypothetical protein
MSIEIIKIKLYTGNTAKIQYIVDKDYEVTAEWKKRIAHEDFTNAMSALAPYLYEMCEMGRLSHTDAELDASLLKGYEATQIVFGGSGESYGCTLVGRKNLAGNRVLNLVAPFISFIDDDRYMNVDELQVAAMKAYNEAVEYINGKTAPDPQLELEL